MPYLLYFVLCLIAAIIGSNRTLGFWGYLVLSVLATPLVSFIILALGATRKKIDAQ